MTNMFRNLKQTQLGIPGKGHTQLNSSRISLFILWFVVFFSLWCFSISCNSRQEDKSVAPDLSGCEQGESIIPMQYAQRISAWRGDGYVRVLVSAMDSQSVSLGYLLVDRHAAIPPECFADYTRIEVPVQKVICVSTTHAALFTALKRQDAIAGLSWAESIYDPILRDRLARGELREISREGSLDLETILDLEPGLVMTYLTADPEYGEFYKMKELGIPALAIAEFMENHPLGQAEWLRLAGWLLGMEYQADSVFEQVATRYQKLKSDASAMTYHPTVFTGLDYQGSWTVPKAGSFAATYIRDAGGRYCWEDVSGTGSMPVDFEVVLERASLADYWLNPGAARSLSSLADRDPRLRHFLAWKNGAVYNNDARMSSGGGNDYWESAIVHPDRVLADLIRILESRSLQEPDSLLYYRKLPVK